GTGFPPAGAFGGSQAGGFGTTLSSGKAFLTVECTGKDFLTSRQRPPRASARRHQPRRNILHPLEYHLRPHRPQRARRSKTPQHGAAGNAGGPRRLDVANLVADRDRPRRRDASALHDAAELLGFAEQRGAAIE